MSGAFFGIGIGPGDPELITLKGHRLLQHCPIIAYPAATGKSAMAYEIVQGFIPKTTQTIRLDIPMVRDAKQLNAAYDHAALTIKPYLDQGKDVAYLCEGDPLFYGSFMYLMHRLGLDYRVQTVPGVSSIMAGASTINQAIVSHDQHLRVLPATMPAPKLEHLLQDIEAGIIMKIGRHFQKVTNILSGLNYLDRCFYVAYATMDDQRVLPLKDAMNNPAPYFSMIYIRPDNAPF